MKEIEIIILEDKKTCSECATEMVKGDVAIKYAHKDLGGYYCHEGCREAMLDHYLEGEGIRIDYSPTSKVLEEIKQEGIEL